MKETAPPRKDSFCLIAHAHHETLFINDEWIISEKLSKLTRWLVRSLQAGACCSLKP